MLQKLCWLALCVSMVGCMRTVDKVELDVVQDVEVIFSSTQGDVAESAVVVFDALASDPAFKTAFPDLICAGLDVHASHLRITTLLADTPTVEGSFQWEVASLGLEAWRTVATFDGAFMKNATIPLSAAGFELNSAGVDELLAHLLEEDPSYRIRVTLTTAQDTKGVSVQVVLKTKMGSHASLCPELGAAGPSPQAMSIEHGVTVDFDAMDTGEAKEVNVALGDLRQDAIFAALHPSLACSTLNLEHSGFRVLALEGPAENFQLELQLRQHSSEPWSPLATYKGDLSAHEVLRLSDERFVDHAEGRSRFEAISQGLTPVLELRVVGTAGSAFDNVELDVFFRMNFSPEACGPSEDGGPPDQEKERASP
jgi:hypothetical protein